MRMIFSIVLLFALLAAGLVLAVGRGLAALFSVDTERPLRPVRG